MRRGLDLPDEPVFQFFQGIAVIYLEDQTPMVVNWTERQQVITESLGDNYQQMYS